LWSTKERRDSADLIELFSSRHLHVPTADKLKLADGSSTGHKWTLVKQCSRCDANFYLFSVRVLNVWNSLSQSTVQATSVKCSKNQLEKFTWIYLWTTNPLNPLLLTSTDTTAAPGKIPVRRSKGERLLKIGQHLAKL